MSVVGRGGENPAYRHGHPPSPDSSLSPSAFRRRFSENVPTSSTSFFINKNELASKKIDDIATLLTQRGYSEIAEAFKRLVSSVEFTRECDLVDEHVQGRMSYNEHGLLHVLYTIDYALQILFHLKDMGVKTTLETNEGSFTSALCAVILGAACHDLGNSVQRKVHEAYSYEKAKPHVLSFFNDLSSISSSKTTSPPVNILSWEDFKASYAQFVSVLDDIILNHENYPAKTVEGSIVKIADALDATYRRAATTFMVNGSRLKRPDIHALSALATDDITLSLSHSDGKIHITIYTTNGAGVFPVFYYLHPKIQSGVLKDLFLFHICVRTPTNGVVSLSDYALDLTAHTSKYSKATSSILSYVLAYTCIRRLIKMAGRDTSPHITRMFSVLEHYVPIKDQWTYGKYLLSSIDALLHSHSFSRARNFFYQLFTNDEVQRNLREAFTRAHYTRFYDYSIIHHLAVTKYALELLFSFHDGGTLSTYEKECRGTLEDAAIVLIGASLLHDVGYAASDERINELTAMRVPHPYTFESVILSSNLIRPILASLVSDATHRERLLHHIERSIAAQEIDASTYSVEEEILRIANKLDISFRRARAPITLDDFSFSPPDMYKLALLAIADVSITKDPSTGNTAIHVVMTDPAGVCPIAERLLPAINATHLPLSLHVFIHSPHGTFRTYEEYVQSLLHSPPSHYTGSV